MNKNYSFVENYIFQYKFCYQCYLKLRPVMGMIRFSDYTLFYQHFYEGLIRESILQFKEGKDIYLGKILFLDLWQYCFKNYIIIPVPSSNKANEKRGFCQTEILCSNFSNIKYNDVINHTGKQEQALTKDRKEITQFLHIQNTAKIKNKKVLILDDIYTSGNTINHIVQLLKPHTKNIKVLALAISPQLRNQSKRFHLPF